MSAQTAATPLEKGPRHVALIMDGNGRITKSRSISGETHRRGISKRPRYSRMVNP